jgi:hypothetical protein
MSCVRPCLVAVLAGVLLFGAVWIVTGWADGKAGTVTVEPRVVREWEER